MEECAVEVEDDGNWWEEYPDGTCKVEPRQGAQQEQGWGEKRQKMTHSGEWKQLRLEDMRMAKYLQHIVVVCVNLAVEIMHHRS